MYGETNAAAAVTESPMGLSPHVRGNRRHSTARITFARSIPACTGKPYPARTETAATRVYPRMYGETADGTDVANPGCGLSPHVRGNPTRLRMPLSTLGSIPACTGKPARALAYRGLDEVYPRMYGETAGSLHVTSASGGLSPHVRGNRILRCSLFSCIRSIPACTGKPRKRWTTWTAYRVYPRMYGETQRMRSGCRRRSGLSPHVRGNQGPGPAP